MQRCLFNHLGQVGIFICDYGPGVKDVSHHNEVINNHIHDLGEIYWHSHGIIIWQSSENLIYRILGKGADGGGINLTGVSEGNIVRRNIIHDILNNRADAAIRLDGSAQGALISENLIYDCTLPAINPGNRVNFIENNIMVDNSTRRWPNQTGHFMFGEGAQGRYQHNIIYNTSESVKYLLDMRGATLSQFDAGCNIFYSTGNPDGSSAFVENLKKQGLAQVLPPGKAVPCQRTISADPFFVNPGEKDFRLRPDSPAWKLGFKLIDFASVGLTSCFPERYR